MNDFKKLIDLARDKETLTRTNPGVDAQLLREWAKVKSQGGERKPKAYDLQRAFEDSAQNMVGAIHSNTNDE
jgi:hypothetical protein